MTKTNPARNPVIGFIGAGKMAGSLIGGLIDKGYPAASLFACDPSRDQLDLLKASSPRGDQLGLYPDSSEIGRADVVVFAVKPQVLKAVCLDTAAGLKSDALIISIAAGITIDSLQSWLGDVAVVRCMPNTPALIGKGASGLYANNLVSDAQRMVAQHVFGSVGIVHWVETEALLDVVTAISGSGPAYFFLFTELMAEVGVEMGLPRGVAEALSIQTCLGAGQLATESEDSLGTLRENVTSPGGTTHAAISRFQSGGLKSALKNAMRDCADRAREMAREFGDST